MNKAMRVVMAGALTVLLVSVWMVQYLFVVPIRIVWRVIVWLFKVAGWAVLLILVPVVGWIILIVIVLMRRGERRHHEVLVALRGSAVEDDTHSMLRPWGIESLRAAWRGVTEGETKLE